MNQDPHQQQPPAVASEPGFTYLTEKLTMGEDQVQIKQKYLLLERIKTLLNGICGSLTRVSEMTKQKHSEAVRTLFIQFEILKRQIARRESFFATHLQKLEMEINNVHQLSIALQQLSKGSSYAEAFDLEIPDLTWLDSVLSNFKRDKDPIWLMIKDQTIRWNRIAELSRKTPRTSGLHSQFDAFTQRTSTSISGMENSEPLVDCIVYENNVPIHSASVPSTIGADDVNTVVLTPPPTALVAHYPEPEDSNTNWDFIEETTEVWGTEDDIRMLPPQPTIASHQGESSSEFRTPNADGLLIRCLLSPPNQSNSPSLMYHNPDSMNKQPNNTPSLPSIVQSLPVLLPSSPEESDECPILPPPPKKDKPNLPAAANQVSEQDSYFGGIKLKSSLLAGIITKGFVEPWPTQRDGILHILEGQDVILNFTKGKTSAAIIGALQCISESVLAPQAILLYPSIQAAQTAFKLCQELTAIMSVKGILLISTETLAPHDIQKNNFAQVIFTTPWILQKIQLVNSQLYDSAKILVLDGANKLLELNTFKSALLKIASRLNNQTQIVVLTCGMSARLADLMRQILRSPVAVNNQPEQTSIPGESTSEIQIKNTYSPHSLSPPSCDNELSSDFTCETTQRRNSNISDSSKDFEATADQANYGSNLTQEHGTVTLENTTDIPVPISKSSTDVGISAYTKEREHRRINIHLMKHYFIKTDCNEEKLLCLKALGNKLVHDQAYIVCNCLEKSVWLFQKLNAISVECHLLLDEHLERKAEIVQRFLHGSIRILILTHETLARSGSALKRVPFMFNFEFPSDDAAYCERLTHAGYDEVENPALDSIQINVFSFLSESNVETVEKLQTNHQITLKDFQDEGF